MKVDEVPQDLKYYEGSDVRDVAYAIDETGHYTTVMSNGWEAKNDALEAAWDEIDNQCEEVLQRVRSGETSPLEYHAIRNLMSVSLLSVYSGFSKRTIRKHFDPKKFAELDDKTLSIYADVLRITVEQLKSIPL
ncbi:MAG: hypothetical protein ACI4A7_07795 [Prevotella sp.]